MNRPQPLRPDRIRTIEKPFAWIPFRLLKGGLFADLSDNAKLLYLFLCLVADRQGTSYYGDPGIQIHFQFDAGTIGQARRELIEKDMLAYDGRLYQVLSLPSSEQYRKPTTLPVESPETKAPAKPRNSQLERLGDILNRIAQQSI